MTTPRPTRRLIRPGSVLLVAAALAFHLFGQAEELSSTPPTPRASRANAAVTASPSKIQEVAGRTLTTDGSGDRTPTVVPRSVETRAAAPGVAGMVIGRDPETGQWGAPTPEQLHELAELRRLSAAERRAIAKPDGPLPEVHHPDGHVSVELDGQFQEFTTVRLGPDGKPVVTCVQGPENAQRVLTEPAAPALEER